MMNIDELVTTYLPYMNPVNGFILVLLSIIFISFLNILKASKRTIQDSNNFAGFPAEENEKFSEDTHYYPESSDGEAPKNNNMEPEEDGDFGIELAQIPESESVTFNPPFQAPGKTENHKETHLNIFLKIHAECQNDPKVKDFVLFTNPQHIFSGALKEIFGKKVAIVINNLEDYKFKKFPFYKIENTKINRFYLEDKKDIIVEELFELWRMGYSHPALPELFIHYFFSIKFDQAALILKSMISHNLLEQIQYQRICFLYQDVLNHQIQFSEISQPLPGKPGDAFDLSNVIIKNQGLVLTRKVWHNWEEHMFADLPEDRKGLFYEFYFEVLHNRTSLILYYLLIKRFRHIFNNQWRDYIERQAFFYGHFEKLALLPFIPPEYVSLISKEAADSLHLMKDLLYCLKDKPFFPLHKFFTLYLNHNSELAKFEIGTEQLKQYISNLDIHYNQKNYIPQAIRFILYLYFYEKRDLNKVNYITPYIHGKIGKFIPRLYQVRLIFKHKEYEKAWLEVNELWNNDEENMLLMNETAVYAYHSGRIREAEELFSRLRHLYPDNTQILHNEAVFLQHKARLITEEKKFYAGQDGRNRMAV